MGDGLFYNSRNDKVKSVQKILDTIDTSKMERKYVDITHMAESQFGITEFVEQNEMRLTFCYYHTWLCTDRFVGIRVWYFDNKPVCISWQPTRKAEEKFGWLSEKDFYLVYNYINSLIVEDYDIHLINDLHIYEIAKSFKEIPHKELESFQINPDAEYTKITFTAGSTIDDAVLQLQKYKGQKVYGLFNDNKLYPHDDLDSAYKKITGLTKSEFDSKQKAEQEEYKRKEEEHKKAIPELTEKWIRKGNEIIDVKYQDEWRKCVPIRLKDLYRGMELGCCLDIIKILNSGGSFEDAKKELDKQGHSGLSYSVVLSMIASFSDRGKSFRKTVEYWAK